jgi:peptidoglycan/LPS O-acetylase OafA/YrhL
MGVIRLLLALSVLITHSAPVFGVFLLSGDMAITAFFIISGFLMALILETKYAGRVRAFYVNRILRIYPPYLVALAGSIVFFFLVENHSHAPNKVLMWFVGAHAWGTLAWSALANLTLLGINLTRYVNLDETGRAFVNFLQPGGFGGHNMLFVPQAWTLSLELYYYALAPLVVLLRTRWIAALTLGTFMLNREAMHMIEGLGVSFSPEAAFPFVLKYFLLGTLAFRFVGPMKALTERPGVVRFLPAASLAGAFVLVFAGFRVTRAFEIDLDWFYLVFASCVPGMFICTNRWRIDAVFGEYSYPVYLFHYPVTISVYMLLPAWHGELTAGITLLLATAYIQLIDKRVEAVRKGIARNGLRRKPRVEQPASSPVPS